MAASDGEVPHDPRPLVGLPTLYQEAASVARREEYFGLEYQTRCHELDSSRMDGAARRPVSYRHLVIEVVETVNVKGVGCFGPSPGVAALVEVAPTGGSRFPILALQFALARLESLTRSVAMLGTSERPPLTIQ